MIPKRAIFYWEGEPMNWLREQSVATFAELNPGWKVEVLRRSSQRGTKMLEIAHRSDIARYDELAGEGGIYFDTDIMFCKPIPDEWLKYDLLLPMGEDGQIGHIAALGASKGSEFFRVARARADHLTQTGALIGYQGYGRDLLEVLLPMLGATNAHWVWHETFIPVAYQCVERLWNPWIDAFPSATVGVHWFANDPLSRAIAPLVDEKWMAKSTSLVAKAWKVATSGDREALCEQHGAC